MILHSPRIDIRPLSLKDLKILIRSRGEYEQHANLTVTGVDLPESYCEELTETIEQYPDVWDNKNHQYLFYTLWLMIEKETKTIIGQFTFNGDPNPREEVDIFFSIETQFRRKGYATEVMETILGWACKTKLFHVVLVEVLYDNKAAFASLNKLGFKKVMDDEAELPTGKYYKVVNPKCEEEEELDFDT